MITFALKRFDFIFTQGKCLLYKKKKEKKSDFCFGSLIDYKNLLILEEKTGVAC